MWLKICMMLPKEADVSVGSNTTLIYINQGLQESSVPQVSPIERNSAPKSKYNQHPKVEVIMKGQGI